MAVKEELLFRFFLQNWLAYLFRANRFRYPAAILIATALWTIGHASVIDPDWVKFAQIAPVGIVLGLLNIRYGILCCIVAHSAFNLVMAGLAPSLLPNMLG